MSSRRWLVLIVVVGALLRLFPIWFGLPYLGARPDEEVATGFARHVVTDDLNPRFFHWPSLTFYVFAALYKVGSLAWSVFGLGTALTDAQHLIICRVFVACAGTGTLIVLFRIGRRVADESTGLIAAALLAVAVLHVRDSHFAMTDVLMTCLVTTSLALLLRAVDERHPRQAMKWFAAAGLAGGFAASTKYNAAAVVGAMAAAQALTFSRPWRTALSLRAWLPSGVFMFSLVIAFFAATPYALLDYGKFAYDLRYDFTHLSEGHGIKLGRGWIYHGTHSLPYGVGITAFAASIPGAALLARDHPRHAFILGSFFAALYLSIGSGYTVFFRYILPLVPIVCLAAAVAVRYAAAWLSSRARVSHRVAFTTLLAVTAAPGLVNSVWFDVLLARTDSRALAGRWLEARLRADDTLHDAGGMYASLDLSRAAFHEWFYDRGSKSFGHPEGKNPDWLVLYESPVFTYTRAPAELQDLARREYILMNTVRATRARPEAGVYDLQDAFFMPVWGFWTVERPGPTIRIFRRKDVR